MGAKSNAAVNLYIDEPSDDEPTLVIAREPSEAGAARAIAMSDRSAMRRILKAAPPADEGSEACSMFLDSFELDSVFADLFEEEQEERLLDISDLLVAARADRRGDADETDELHNCISNWLAACTEPPQGESIYGETESANEELCSLRLA